MSHGDKSRRSPDLVSLLVLTLLVVARSSVLDNWAWPHGLVLIHWHHCGMGVGERYVAQARAAEHLRETALNDLRRFRLLGQESDVKRPAFDELMAEIRDLKTSAFAPLSDQPFIRAVLFPGAPLGFDRRRPACVRHLLRHLT